MSLEPPPVPARAPLTPGKVEGFVEAVHDVEVSGWAFHGSEAPLPMELRLDGHPVHAEVTWQERDDVAAVHGPSARLAGFRMHVTGPEASHFRTVAARGGRVDVVAGGIVLARAASLDPPGGFDTLDGGWNAAADAAGFDDVPGADPNVLGYVESIGVEQIAGWAFDRTGAAVQLTLVIGDDILESERLVWVRRPEIAMANGHPYERCGFVIPLSPGESERAARVIGQGGEIYVLANGFPLPSGAQPRAQAPAAPIESTPDAQGGHARLERAASFMLSGWAVSAEGTPSRLQVLANGEPLECLVLPRDRRDVADGLRIQRQDLGFEIELPPAVWTRTTGDDPILVEVLADGLSINPEPLRLTRTLAATWVAQLSDLPQGAERDVLAMLAIQHVRAARLLELLDERALLQIRWFAGRTGLERFLHGDEMPSLDLLEPPRESPHAERMRLALGQLNDRLAHDRAHVLPHLREVLADPALVGEVRLWVQFLGVQLTCATGEFPQMRELIDFDELLRFEGSPQPNQMSLALAALAADGQVQRAAKLLFALSKRIGGGWTHMECIRFAVAHVDGLDAAGEIAPDAAEEFRRALVAVLGGCRGDWFSRLHDEMLVDAFVVALSGLDRYADDHRELLATAAAWHYGLSPAFWSRWRARDARPRHPLLDRAGAAWDAVDAWMRLPRDEATAALDAIVEPLEFFHGVGNPEALIVVRDVVQNELLVPGRAPAGLERRLVGLLLDADPREALRVAAFPSGTPDAVQDAFAATRDSGHLRALIRRENPGTHGRTQQLQAAAAVALRDAAEAAHGSDAERKQSTLSAAEACAVRLLRADAQFVGVDLLATVCALAARGGEEGGALAARVDRLVRSARRVVTENELAALPLPLQTALLSIGRRSHETAAGERALRETLRERFGAASEKLLNECPAEPVLRVGSGWPSDTVVAIVSCRAHLDTRVKTIRETWLPRLQEAGIPYVIVVGGGEDRIEGDVLALDVGDGYEHRAGKTLRTFGWLVRNTAASFVMKIEDDAQLDVDAFFGALAYRRWAYYGRVVTSAPGTFERVGFGWHAGPEDGMPVVDRSPDGSTYCDGRLAYVLSRSACAALDAAARTVAGRRLVALSTHEDKLVGDLLASAGIAPRGDDFEGFVQARLRPEAVPVGVAAGSLFDLSAASPTQVAHRGDGGAAGRPGLFPNRIWPTAAAPSLAPDGNSLQRLTPPERARDALRAPHAVVVVMRNERELAPHFLDHYRKLGLRCFLVADNGSTDGTREFLLGQPDVVLYAAATDYRDSHFGVAWQQALLGAHGLGKWVVVADADEFLVYEDSESRPFADLVTAAEYEGADALATYMIDLYPKGPLDAASFASASPFAVADHFDGRPLLDLHVGGGLYSNVTNRVNGLRHRIAPTKIDAYTSQKCAVLKYHPWVRLSEGIHYAANVKMGSAPTFFAHFKYHAAFRQKVADELRRKQHFNNAEEYRHFARILAPGASLYAEGVSRPFRTSGDFMAALDPEHFVSHDPEDDEFGTPAS